MVIIFFFTENCGKNIELFLHTFYAFSVSVISENRSLNLSAFLVAWDLKLGETIKELHLKNIHFYLY